MADANFDPALFESVRVVWLMILCIDINISFVSYEDCTVILFILIDS